MVLEGTVSNVTNFGAFVDLGVHQDGLVHISAMADHFVKDPHTVVKAGEVVKVKVLSVDLERRRIALSMRLDDSVGERKRETKQNRSRPAPKAAKRRERPAGKQERSAGGAMADALAKALKQS